jgi:cellulose biosynthesis protein BcsQ
MNFANPSSSTGIIYTFYSYKGGVGRSMALANCAALLAKWGSRVLIVDWDLEAPGLERFFSEFPDVMDSRTKKQGVLDLIENWDGKANLDWRECRITIPVANGASRLDLITAGLRDKDYSRRLHAVDFPTLFEQKGLGKYIEQLREEWTADYDFVLLDSRTGVTDIGGICTVHLADILVLLFTTTDSSVDGIRQIVDRAREERGKLPVDRANLVAIPVPARDESRTEYQQSQKWKQRTAEKFRDLYEDWLPSKVTAEDAVELLRIPYIPYWSFGEKLPVIEEGTRDPSSLGRSYEVLARLISSNLDWNESIETARLQSTSHEPRALDPVWLSTQRKNSSVLTKKLNTNRHQNGGYLEAFYWLTNARLDLNQRELLANTQAAEVRTWTTSIGIVPPNEFRPRPMANGIQMEILDPEEIHYWAASREGDFYFFRAPLNLHSPNTINFKAQIELMAGILSHCHRFYSQCERFAFDEVEFSFTHAGFLGFVLDGYEPGRLWTFSNAPASENLIARSQRFRLGDLETNFFTILKDCCNPFFRLFDYREFDLEVYQRIAGQFGDLTPIRRA